MNPRVRGAVIVGIAFVAAAVVISNFRTPGKLNTQPVAIVEPPTFMAVSPLRQHIPVTDSNNDGIPDWQELLDNSVPLQLPATSSAYAAPETLTDQFALEFFETYVRNEGFGAFARPPEEIVGQASQSLVAEARDTLYFEADITIVSATRSEINQYANRVAEIILDTHLPAGTRSEIEIVEQAVASNNQDVLTELTTIIENYDAIISSMKNLPVPKAMVKEHLDLLNALQAIRNDIAAMQQLFSDPLHALLRLQRYQDDAVGLRAALTNLFAMASSIGTGFTNSDAVSRIYRSR